ncbi:MAG: extracellular solute-binding protein [Bauldia sp.]|uniref:extracellular solute-binding protein n=1 Tax=Bauldia sp. TaxID=2575872 RepID=UPI001DF1CD69|nr:extracellular solute-binding protein [Bauldia sp.]MCB1495842.1 extracellular solute-binding protein [Bauldia sp.]
MPEGPYETGQEERFQAAPSEMHAVLDAAEQLESAAERALPLKHGYREMRMVIYLMRCHLAGRLVTSAALAAASGMAFATAMRGINDMWKRGLIVKRARTATGRSFSLHPSADLLARWQDYAVRMREVLTTNDLIDTDEDEEPASAVALSGPPPPRVVPPPAVLETKLALGKSIRFLVHADPTFTAMNALRKQFEMIFGVEIRSRALSIDRLRAEVIDNGRLKRSKYDIVACDLPWFGEMAQRGLLLPLDDLIGDGGGDLADFHPEALASSRYMGVQYGVPIMTTAEILVYRKDLFADAGLKPPATASEMLAAARALHRPEAGLSGIAWNGGRGTPIGHTFIMILGAFGQAVVDLRRRQRGYDAEHVRGEQMRPMFLTGAARETAEYLMELKDYSPPNILEMAWYDRAITYAQGKAACAYSHSLLASLFELNETSPAFRRTGYLPHPVGPRGRPIAPLGGYALAIPANLDPGRVDDVWVALQSLTSPSAAKLYATNGSLAFPRFSVGADPEVRAMSPMIAAVEEMAQNGLLQMWPRPPIPEISEIIAITGEEIHDLLSGDRSVEPVLANIQNRVDALMRANGHY